MVNRVSHVKLSILIPVRNEGVNLKLMIKLLISILEERHEILIIYDSKNDNSIPVVYKIRKKFNQVKSVQNQFGKGVGNAIKTGVQVARGEYILIFLADEVGPILAIENMLELMEKGCELVSCTRYAYGGRRLGGSLLQAILSRIANRLFHMIVGSTFTDSTTGIKMFRKTIADKLTLESSVGWAVVFELAIKAQILGLKLGEVPIISIDRLYGGKSSFQLGPWFREYLKWFLYGIYKLHTTSRKKRPIRVSIPKSTAV